MQYDGVKWELTTQADPANTLAGLTDVSNVSPTNGHFLKYSNGQWSPAAAVIDLSSGVGSLVASPANGVFEIRGATSTNSSGSLQLNCESNSHAIVIEGPPHSANANYTLTLPDDVGSNGQVLQTDGTGGLSWLTVGGSGNSVSFSSVPTTETVTGSVGEMALDTVYLYVCVSTNNWKRIPLQTFSGATGGGSGGSTTGIFISTQPQGGNATGGTFDLSLSATVPSGTLTYQWQEKVSGTFTDISGATNSSHELTSLTSADDGKVFRCVLSSDSFSSVSSNEVTVTVASSGVSGVTSSKPGLLFDRNFSDTYSVGLWRATGGNWSYTNAGWTLVREQTKWEYSSTNLGTTTTLTGGSSLPSRNGSFTYGLMGVPPKVTDLEDSYDYQNSSSVPSHYVSIVDSDDFDVSEWVYWSSPNSAAGMWNRAARFATRVILQRFVNGVEEQVTTDYSEFSDWRSDPGGNIFTTQDTVFTTQPTPAGTAGSHTMYPGDTHTLSAVISGTNKRYLWQVNNSFNENDWFTGEETSDGRFYADDSLLLRASNSTLLDVGTHTVKCLGASDWNKAVFSSSRTIILPSTDDSSSSPISVSEMDGFTAYSIYGINGNSNSSSSSGFWIPQIKLMKAGSVFIDLTASSSSGYSVNPYRSQKHFRNGKFKFIFEYATNYGSGSGATWQHLQSVTKNIDSDGDWMPPSAYAYSGYGQIRVKWKMEDVDVNEDYDTYAASSSTNLTTVWSDWSY